MGFQSFSTALIAACCISSPLAHSQPNQQSFPKRIITVAPHLSEIVDAAGGAEHLISVSAFSNFPESIKKLPITSDSRSVDLERMKQLKPDLIIYWRGGMPETQIEAIKKTFSSTGNKGQAATQIISVEPKKLIDIAKDIEFIGKVLGTQTIANKNAREFSTQIMALKSKYQSPNKRKVRVFYQVWSQPLMTLNQDHLIADIIQICGGEQLFAKEKLLVPTVSREAVVEANPEIIFTATDSASMKVDWSMWASNSQLAASKNKAFIALDGDMISRPSPRIIQGANKICSEIDKVRQHLLPQ
jgi:iron complex transport system substrate-binding protein